MTTQSAELPFLVEHGGWFWVALLAGLTLATFALRQALRRSLIRRTSRARRANFEARAAALGLRVVEGQLRGQARTVSQGQGERFNSERSEHLGIQSVENGFIALEGAIEVRDGSTQSVRWMGLPAVSPALLVGLEQHADTLTADVVEGDWVIACGAAGGISTHAAAGYRDNAGGLALTAHTAPVWISSIPTRAPKRSIGRLTLFASIISLFWYGVMSLAGSTLRDDLREAEAPPDLSSVTAQIAAALPGSRGEVLEMLQQSHGAKLNLSQRQLPVVLALARLRGTCPNEILTTASRFEEALAAARRCGSEDDVVELLLLLGRYDEAAATATGRTSWANRIAAAIGAGDWSKAATLTEEYAGPNATDTLCLAALVRTYAGETDAFAKVPNREGNVRCEALSALSAEPSRWAETFAETRQPRDTRDWHVAGELWSVIGGTPQPAHVAIDPWWVWLAPLAVMSPEQKTVEQLDEAHALLAQQAILLGEFQRAADDLGRMSAKRESYARDLMTFQLAVRAPGLAQIDGAFARKEAAYHDYLAGTVQTPFCRLAAHTAVASARAGDGVMLARALDTCSVLIFDNAFALIEAVGRVRTHRAELAAAFRTSRTNVWLRAERLTELVIRIAYQRDLAHVLGDEPEAAALQAIVARHGAMLADPRRVVALTYWNTFH